MNEELVIDHVDFDMLESQRQRLNTVIDRSNRDGWTGLSNDESDALQGIAAMLDAWSDARWHRQQAGPSVGN